MSDDETDYSIAFEDWCKITTQLVNAHDLKVLALPDDKFDVGCKSTASAVPAHYAAPERVAGILQKLGKEKAAKYLRDKLPQLPKIRSGDLGELLATEFIREHTPYTVPINRLRWKDHRNMPLRGDDVIGVTEDEVEIAFLKSEVKSRKSLSASVVASARAALDANGGLPSPHALAYVSDRLHETGQDALSDRILRSQLQDGITVHQVEHLLFTFSANTPGKLLEADLNAYGGQIHQNDVGFHAVKHQEFIATVFEIVEADNKP
jgi:hypothetical protein